MEATELDLGEGVVVKRYGVPIHPTIAIPGDNTRQRVLGKAGQRSGIEIPVPTHHSPALMHTRTSFLPDPGQGPTLRNTIQLQKGIVSQSLTEPQAPIWNG